jgi:hypothetical protein
MSIPPAIKTTNKPKAQIRLTALLFNKLVKLFKVKKVSVKLVKKIQIKVNTTINLNSV